MPRRGSELHLGDKLLSEITTGAFRWAIIDGAGHVAMRHRTNGQREFALFRTRAPAERALAIESSGLDGFRIVEL